jgi:hypothetical protein
MAEMTINEWLLKNNVPRKVIKNGKYIVAISCNHESADTIVHQAGIGSLPMKKISNLELVIDDKRTRVFVMKATAWRRMTQQNLWLSDKTEIIDKDKEKKDKEE